MPRDLKILIESQLKKKCNRGPLFNDYSVMVFSSFKAL